MDALDAVDHSRQHTHILTPDAIEVVLFRQRNLGGLFAIQRLDNGSDNRGESLKER